MRRQLLMMASACSMAAQAQKAPVFETSAKDEIAANRYLAGSNYLDYDRQLTDKALTPAPKGYVPYYMSHYGRHGADALRRLSGHPGASLSWERKPPASSVHPHPEASVFQPHGRSSSSP